MIFIDSNVPMYVVGAPHPLKFTAEQILQRSFNQRERLVTDAEVLQEILHRYVSLRRWTAVEDAFQALFQFVEEVLSIERRDVQRAKEIAFDYRRLSARDAVHVAIMQRHGIDRIMTFDAAFDRISGITRISS